MRTAREFNSLAELANLRSAWAELLRQTPDATWFQSLEWLETYWQFFGDAERLRVVVIEDDGQPIGILPLVVVTETRRVGRMNVLTYPLHGWGSFYGPIGPDPAATLEAGLQHIQQTPRDWDLLDLRWVAAFGSDCGTTPQALHAAGFNHFSSLWHTSAQAELHHGWEAYWRTRKSHWRNNIRRSERQLSQRGEIEHVRYRPLGGARGNANPRWDLYDACVEIARRSWQGDSQSGTTLSHESVREYLRAAHVAAVESGAVDLNLLLLDAQPAAFAYNYHYQGNLYGLRSGFDPALAQEGAGTVLMAHMIEDSCRRGDRLLDLGPDYFDCKRYWLTRLQPAYHYTHYRPGRIRAQALRLKHAVSRWIPAKSLSGDTGKRSLPA
jgi:CelD/BcsL family acetyltransferase involved in cellulose biosynthesis